jgi:hypothetical protein
VLLHPGLNFICPEAAQRRFWDQIFGRFKPALGLPEETLGSGILRRLDWRIAIIVAGMFLLAVLRLSHVSPFLYYQF